MLISQLRGVRFSKIFTAMNQLSDEREAFENFTTSKLGELF